MKNINIISKVYAIIPEIFNLNELCKSIEVMLIRNIFFNIDLNLKKYSENEKILCLLELIRQKRLQYQR